MVLIDEIQNALKENKAIIGYKESLRFLKVNSPKLIVIAQNIPENYKKEIEHNAKVSKIKIEVFDGSSKKLGVICGKPFSVSTLAIK
jgi:large subunit ribosomal protein L30e